MAKRDLFAAILFLIAGIILFFNDKVKYMSYVFLGMSLIFFALYQRGRDKE